MDKQLTKSLGRILHSKRNEKRWTLETLAKKVGISFGHLAALERGQHRTTLETYMRIASALGCTFSSVLYEYETAQQATLEQKALQAAFTRE